MLSIVSFVQLMLLASLPSISNGLDLYDEKTCGAHPDPHFHIWDGPWYDYQGACDLVLIKKIQDPLDPDDNLSLELHISTQKMGGYSKISKVGLRINSAEYVFESSTDHSGMPPTLGGYPFTLDSTSSYPIFDVNLGPGYFIRIMEYSPTYGFSVQVNGNGALFMNSEGMCGSWNAGGVADRSGTPFTNPDTTTWAQHWQVQESEKIYDLTAECTGPAECGKDFPDPPAEGKFPCQREDGHLRTLNDEKDCDKSCNDIPAEYPELRSNCYYDVIVTGDKSFACQPAYTNPVVAKPSSGSCDAKKCVSTKPNLCEKNGGRCVRKCKTSFRVSCNPFLCKEYNEFEEEEPQDKKDRCDCAIPVKPTRPIPAVLTKND